MGRDLENIYYFYYKVLLKAPLLKSTLTGTFFHSMGYIICLYNFLRFCQPTGLPYF